MIQIKSKQRATRFAGFCLSRRGLSGNHATQDDQPIGNLQPTVGYTSDHDRGRPSMTTPAYPAATHFTLASGARVLDRYTIQRGLGIGGFGEVYFAISDAGKEVAIKKIQRNLEIELRGVSHCLNLKHPNLISLFDVCRDETQAWWVVMEYVAGASLRDALDRNPGGLTDAETRRWFAGAASGVAHLHREGLVHRDLKPGNLFDDYGVVKVGDYGLSKFISESRRGGQTESVGTFHYMAPEIGRGEYGREIDLYALGVILYEMLTGRLPFDGESAHEIIVKHLSSHPDLTGIAQPYRDVIEKALRKDPRQRWTSASAMLDAINGDSVPLVATLVSRPGQKPPTATSAADPIKNAQFGQSAATATDQPSDQPIQQTSEEPIARAVVALWHNLAEWWKEVRLSPAARTLVVIMLAFILMRNLKWMLPLLTVLGSVYVPYYVIRQVLVGRNANRNHTYIQTGQNGRGGRGPARRPIPRMTRKQWREYKRSTLASKRASTQLAELSGSWIASAIAAIFCAVAAGVIGLRNGNIDALAIAPFGWITVIGFSMSAVILGLGKLWEGRDGDPLNRRIVLAGAGGLLGALAYGVFNHLMIPVEPGVTRVLVGAELPQALYDSDALPRLSAWMLHFALLAAVVRWWRLTDPMRSRRLSLWSVAVVVVADWLIQQLIPIPQPWGMMVAGTAAIAVQIAATWESDDDYTAAVTKGIIR
jgi:serine/threonine protein kinase